MTSLPLHMAIMCCQVTGTSAYEVLTFSILLLFKLLNLYNFLLSDTPTWQTFVFLPTCTHGLYPYTFAVLNSLSEYDSTVSKWKEMETNLKHPNTTLKCHLSTNLCNFLSLFYYKENEIYAQNNMKNG